MFCVPVRGFCDTFAIKSVKEKDFTYHLLLKDVEVT